MNKQLPEPIKYNTPPDGEDLLASPDFYDMPPEPLRGSENRYGLQPRKRGKLSETKNNIGPQTPKNQMVQPNQNNQIPTSSNSTSGGNESRGLNRGIQEEGTPTPAKRRLRSRKRGNLGNPGKATKAVKFFAGTGKFKLLGAIILLILLTIVLVLLFFIGSLSGGTCTGGNAALTTDGHAFPLPTGTYNYTDTWGGSRSGGRTHHGTDIFADEGTPVLAVNNGVLSRAGSNTLGGNTIYIDGDDGNFYYYAHLLGNSGTNDPCRNGRCNFSGPKLAPGLTVGTRVIAGQELAYVSNSGSGAQSTPKHLHFGMSPTTRSGGDRVTINPYPYLQTWDPEAGNTGGTVGSSSCGGAGDEQSSSENFKVVFQPENNSKGGNGYNESDEMKELANIAQGKMPNSKVCHDPVGDNLYSNHEKYKHPDKYIHYENEIKCSNAFGPPKYFISLHTNATGADEDAWDNERGTLILIPKNSSQATKNLAKDMLKEIVAITGKTTGYSSATSTKIVDGIYEENLHSLMPDHEGSVGNKAEIKMLIEIAYHNNRSDRKIIMENKDELAEAITGALKDQSDDSIPVGGPLLTPPGLGEKDDYGYYNLPENEVYEDIYASSCARKGKITLVKTIYTAAKYYAQKNPGHKIRVGDLNQFPDHDSHRFGIAGDITTNRGMMIGDGYDKNKAIDLGKILVDTGSVRKILYNDREVRTEVNRYAKSKGKGSGFMSYHNGHENHFHIIINEREGRFDSRCRE